MTEDKKEQVLEKVRKLLALATSSNEHEAVLAAERAHSMLVAHNLSLRDVEKDKGHTTNFAIDDELVTDSYPWRRQIAANVAQLYFCKYFYWPRKEGNTTYDTHCFAGEDHNISVAKMMFQYLHTTVDRLAREGARKVPQKQRSPYRVSFRHAATMRLCTRIGERIQAARAGTAKTEAGTTLPALASMYDQVQNQLKDFLEKEVGGFQQKKRRKPRKSSQSLLGMIDGSKAGDEIGLDAQVQGAKSSAMVEDKSHEHTD